MRAWKRNPYYGQGLDKRQARRLRKRPSRGIVWGTCTVVKVDGLPVRVNGSLDTPEDRAAFAEIVRAARRRYDEEHS